MRSVEVCIIGAGTAGLNAARHIQRDAVVIDQKPEIGLPVRCGEGISTAALLREQMPFEGDFMARKIYAIDRFFPGNIRIGSQHTDVHALILHKEKFERFLASQVKVQVHLNTRLNQIQKEKDFWLIKTNQGDWRSRFVIAADGPASLVRRNVLHERLPLIGATSYVLESEGKYSGPDCALFFGNQVAPAGYAWIFRQEANKFNVGVISHRHFNTRKYLNAFLVKQFGDHVKSESRSGYLPAEGWNHRIFYENCFFVGDAGGFVDPLFSGGISLALTTGRLAAEAINRNAPDAYANAIARLPCSIGELNWAGKFFYSLDDAELQTLSQSLQPEHPHEVFTAHSTQRENFSRFAAIWQQAKTFVW